MRPPHNNSRPLPCATTDTKPIATQWRTGDFTLISSDNHVFKIDSHYLKSAAWVFRNAPPAGGTADSRTVTFTDDKLETSLIIGHFLYLITSGILPEWLGAAGRFEAEFGVDEAHRWEHETAILYDLCTFLIKYDCLKEVNALLNHVLFRVMEGKLRFLSGFVLASIADKPAHCVAFLAADAKDPQFWGDFPHVVEAHRSISDRPLMDPRAMPLAWYRRIPGDYQWALTRAWDIHTTNRSFAVAAEFEDIMKHLKKKT